MNIVCIVKMGTATLNRNILKQTIALGHQIQCKKRKAIPVTGRGGP
jgi:hypothetical protein